MATKIQMAGMKPVEQLSGSIQGKRFHVVLDDIKIGDKWDSEVLSVLQRDGIGKVTLNEGATEFTFNTVDHATLAFTADAGQLVISAMFVAESNRDA